MLACSRKEDKPAARATANSRARPRPVVECYFAEDGGRGGAASALATVTFAILIIFSVTYSWVYLGWRT